MSATPSADRNPNMDVEKMHRLTDALEQLRRMSLPSSLQLGAETDHPSDETQKGEDALTKKIKERVEELNGSHDLDSSVENVADQIKQRWTHPDKFREIASGLTNILGRLMRGGEVTVKNEELQHYRNKIVHLYDLICDKFPDRKHFDVIWQWVKYTLYEKLGLRK